MNIKPDVAAFQVTSAVQHSDNRSSLFCAGLIADDRSTANQSNSNVRFGSKADIASRPVRSSTQSRHSSARVARRYVPEADVDRSGFGLLGVFFDMSPFGRRHLSTQGATEVAWLRGGGLFLIHYEKQI
jgi:hypothetical protein